MRFVIFLVLIAPASCALITFLNNCTEPTEITGTFDGGYPQGIARMEPQETYVLPLRDSGRTSYTNGPFGKTRATFETVAFVTTYSLRVAEGFDTGMSIEPTVGPFHPGSITCSSADCAGNFFGLPQYEMSGHAVATDQSYKVTFCP